MATFPDVNDRNVQYPNRYRMKAPDDAGEGEVVDLVPEYGSVIDLGTPLNSALFDGVKEYVDDTSNVMGYLPGSLPGKPINGFDANIVDRGRASLIPMYNGVNTPSISVAVLETIPYASDWVVQYFHEIGATDERVYRRVFKGSSSTWTGWKQLAEVSAAADGALEETYFYTTDSTLTLGGVIAAMYPTLPNGLRAVDVNRAGSRMAMIVNKTSDLYGTVITTSYSASNSMHFSRLSNGTWSHSRVNMTAI